jgi:murein L,D-transpeptidase YcbB/YkuD
VNDLISMFPYDQVLAAAVETPPQSIVDVLQTLQTVATCGATATVPEHSSPQYTDYTSLNTTLDSLIESAKHTLHVRLLGDALPPASHLEDLIAAWGVSAARETAWTNAEILWRLRWEPPLDSRFMDTLDDLTTVTNKTLLIPVP